MEARSSRPSPVERASSSDRMVWARYIVRNRNILLGSRQARCGEARTGRQGLSRPAHAETRAGHACHLAFTKRKVMQSDSPIAAYFARSTSWPSYVGGSDHTPCG